MKASSLIAGACIVGWGMAHAGDSTLLELDRPAVQLEVKKPASDDGGLAGTASLDLAVPDLSMKLKAAASVGADDRDLWNKRSTEVDARWLAPWGAQVTASGSGRSMLTYQTPADIRGSQARLVRTDEDAAKLAATFSPLDRTTVEVGAAGRRAANVDLSAPGTAAQARAALQSASQEIYAKLDWTPRSWLGVEAAAVARSQDMTHQAREVRVTSYSSLDPRLGVTVKPWEGATVTTGVEHVVSPYDAGAFTTYANSAPANGGPRFAPDHAWQLQTQLRQSLGPATLSASFSERQSGTVTEYAPAGGSQSPSAASLEKATQVGLSLSMPLDALGLPNATLNSGADWRDSLVRDPVTSEMRRASGEMPHRVSFRLEQTLPSSDLSVGVAAELAGMTTSYQVNEVSARPPAGTLGAFLAYKPGPFEFDLKLSGIGAPATTNTIYGSSRADPTSLRTVVQPAPGPELNVSLRKAL